MDQERPKVRRLILVLVGAFLGGCSVAVVVGSGTAIVEAHQAKGADLESDIEDHSQDEKTIDN